MVSAALALSVLLAADPSTAPRRLTVLVKIDTPALDRYVRASDVAREIHALWDAYVEVDVADLAAPVDRVYDEQLRLVVDERGSSMTAAGESLGWITFTEPGQPADVITVSIGGARSLIVQGHWRGRRLADLTHRHQQQFMTRALARSAAHEIGHYLLRSSAHTRTGLMRDRLTVDIIMDNDLRALRLDAPQIDALRGRASKPRFAVNGNTWPAGTE